MLNNIFDIMAYEAFKRTPMYNENAPLKDMMKLSVYRCVQQCKNEAEFAVIFADWNNYKDYDLDDLVFELFHSDHSEYVFSNGFVFSRN